MRKFVFDKNQGLIYSIIQRDFFKVYDNGEEINCDIVIVEEPNGTISSMELYAYSWIIQGILPSKQDNAMKA